MVKTEVYRDRQSDISQGEAQVIAGESLKAPSEAAIGTAALTMLVRSGIPLVILDARPREFDDGFRIPGARSLRPDSPLRVIESVVGDKDALIVTYCINLYSPASIRLCRQLKKSGYENVLHYLDGLAGWIAAGHDVERADVAG